MSVARSLLMVVNPAAYLVGRVAEYAIDSVTDSEAKNATLDELKLAAQRQDIQMQMAQAQAKVAQELAIAKKIEMADEVEIEEYYDLSGEAKLGASQNESSISAGLSAGGRRVTKRIYKFRGGAASSPDEREAGDDERIVA